MRESPSHAHGRFAEGGRAGGAEYRRRAVHACASASRRSKGRCASAWKSAWRWSKRRWNTRIEASPLALTSSLARTPDFAHLARTTVGRCRHLLYHGYEAFQPAAEAMLKANVQFGSGRSGGAACAAAGCHDAGQRVWHHHAGSSESTCPICHLSHQPIDSAAGGESGPDVQVRSRRRLSPPIRRLCARVPSIRRDSRPRSSRRLEFRSLVCLPLRGTSDSRSDSLAED